MLHFFSGKIKFYKKNDHFLLQIFCIKKQQKKDVLHLLPIANAKDEQMISNNNVTISVSQNSIFYLGILVCVNPWRGHKN